MIYHDLIKNLLDDISFIELKEGRKVSIGAETFYGPIYLPIKNTSLAKMIEESQENIDLPKVAEAIVYVLALGEDNQAFFAYEDILKSYVSYIGPQLGRRDKLSSYLLGQALDFLDQGYFDHAMVYIKALLDFGYEDEKILFYLGLALENMDISNLTDEKRQKYLIEIMNVYEKTLNYNPDFALGHYKLGYIYRDFMQYKKSQFAFEKFLSISNDDLKNQEVREALDQMEGDIYLEEAVDLISRQDLRGALDKLGQIRQDHLTDLHYYYISFANLSLGQLGPSLDAINKALTLRQEFSYYNQKALVYSSMGQDQRAMGLLEDVIEKNGPNYHLNYNLASLYYKQGQLDWALDNYNIAYDLEPSQDLADLLAYIKESVKHDH